MNFTECSTSKDFILLEREREEHKGGDKSMNPGLKRGIKADYFNVLYNLKL